MTENGENLRLIFFLAKRCNSELKQRRQPEVVFFHFWTVVLRKCLDKYSRHLEIQIW